jgi:hypothetical protein
MKKRKLGNSNLAMMLALAFVVAPIVRPRRNSQSLITQY